MRARALLVVAVAVLAVLAACGLPKDSSPRVIAGDKVPFSLLGPTSTEPGGQTDAGGQTVDVFFVSGDHLMRVSRQATDVSPQPVLEALVKGVAEGDGNNLSSAIPQNTKIVAADRDGTTVVVTLSSEILSVTGPEQKAAFAQLVFTATGLADVDGVRFRAPDTNGNLQDLEPTTDTGLKQGPLTRRDFSSLRPQ